MFENNNNNNIYLFQGMAQYKLVNITKRACCITIALRLLHYLRCDDDAKFKQHAFLILVTWSI